MDIFSRLSEKSGIFVDFFPYSVEIALELI